MTPPSPMHAYLVGLAVIPAEPAPAFTVEEWCAVIGLAVSAACSLARMVWLWRRDKRDATESDGKPRRRAATAPTQKTRRRRW